MLRQEKYDIQLPQFEGPFDLLLFFIERDELDIYDIPIAKITGDFLAYIKQQEVFNIELSSDFMLFASKLIHIKVCTLFPRREVDEQGNEIDPRQELIDQLAAYKQYKKIAGELASREADRMQMVGRGNAMMEVRMVGEKLAQESNSELYTLTLSRLMKAFEKVLRRLQDLSLSRHLVERFQYRMESCREDICSRLSQDKQLHFHTVFGSCQSRIHAVFMFLALLELVQLSIAGILLGEGHNNFIVEYKTV